MKKTLLLILLFLFVFSFPSSLHAESVSADLNNNGVSDLKGFFNSDDLTKTELDRNEDGQADVWMYFVPKGVIWDTRADYDEDYNGKVDEVFFIKGDKPVRSLADRDKDGMLEEETLYSEGAPQANKALKPPIDPQKLEYSPK